MPGNELIQSLARGLDILALLAAAEHGLRLKQLADQLELKSPTVHNLLRTLRSKGFVMQTQGSSLYRIGPRLDELTALQVKRPLIRRAEDAVYALAERFPDATVTFSEPVGGEITIRRRMSPDQPGVIQLPTEHTLPLYSSASGLATLAFADQATSRLLEQRHPLLEEGAQLWHPPQRLDAYLSETRASGCAVHPSGDAKRQSIAAPVYDPDGQLAGTLGLSRVAKQDAALLVADRQHAVQELLVAAQTVKVR